jgi:hypothetical protein
MKKGKRKKERNKQSKRRRRRRRRREKVLHRGYITLLFVLLPSLTCSLFSLDK